MPVTLPRHAIRPFTSPVNNGQKTVDANVVRANDNIVGAAFVAHDADAAIHVQSGTLAERPATASEGSVWVATDVLDTFCYVGSQWEQIGWAHWYGGFYDTTASQAASTINTPTVVTFDTTAVSRGVTLQNNSEITVDYANTYNAQFSVQLLNTKSQESDVWLWLRKNGSNVVDSAGRVTVPPRHGGVDGHMITGWNQFVELDAGDYIELYWETTDLDTTLETVPAAGGHPAAPAVIFTLNRV